MGVTVAVTRVACNTSTGTQDITTTDLGGLTPKAARIVVSYATTDGTAAAHNVLSIGFVDGTRESTMGMTDENGQLSTDNDRFGRSAICVQISNPGAQTADGIAAFSAWLTNGFRINWTDAPAAAYLLTATFYAGSDLSAYVGAVNVGDTVDNTIDVTAPAFTPDAILTLCPWAADAEYGGKHYISGAGFVHYDGVSTITQRAVAQYYRDGQATSANNMRATASGGLLTITNSGALDWYGEFTDFDANGFSIITRNAGGNGQVIYYLALNFGGVVGSWVGTHTTPTATGNDSETGPNFTPQHVHLLTSLVEVVDTAYTDNRSGSFGISEFTSSVEYTTVWTSEDAVGTSNTQSLSDDRAIVVPADDGTLDIEATFDSFGANGWTVNYSNAPATAKLFFALAIEEEAAAGGEILTRYPGLTGNMESMRGGIRG